MMHKKKLFGKRVGFPFFIQINIEVIIFPQAQWKVRVRETDSDYVIWVKYPEKDKRQDMVCTPFLF